MNEKIAISSNTSWSIYNFRLNLLKTLKEKDYKITIVAPYDKYAEKLKEEFEYYSIFIDNRGTNLINDLKTSWQYHKLYKEIKPDIILHFTIKPNIYGNFACNLLNISVINNITGLGTVFIKQNLVTNIVKVMYKIAFKNSFVFFQNNNDKNLFLNLNLIKKNRCDVLPGSGVDISKFTSISTEKKDNIFRFLLIARMLWDKGIGEYVEAAKIIKRKYKNVEFLLLGAIGVENPTAISKEKIKEWEKQGLVKYLGTTDNVKEEIAKTDCAVLPSYYREGVPKVLLEASAMAKPIITTDNVGCKEVVDDGINGYLCEVKNSVDLAAKIEKMINLSEKERTKMGQAGREKIVKEFDEKIVIDKYLKIIEKIK